MRQINVLMAARVPADVARWAAVSWLALCLAACQPMPTRVASNVSTQSAAQHQASAGWVNVHCSGGLACQINRVDDVMLTRDMDPKHAISLQKESSLTTRTADFFVRMPAGLHQMQLSFYPVTVTRAEQFVLIHDFKAGQSYDLHLYRDRNVRAGSVLSRAAPDPLCVELLAQQQQVRRFCRPFDAQTGLGEFIEQPITP